MGYSTKIKRGERRAFLERFLLGSLLEEQVLSLVRRNFVSMIYFHLYSLLLLFWFFEDIYLLGVDIRGHTFYCWLFYSSYMKFLPLFFIWFMLTIWYDDYSISFILAQSFEASFHLVFILFWKILLFLRPIDQIIKWGLYGY